MNKDEVLKNLFLLNDKDILDINKIINGYKESLNRRDGKKNTSSDFLKCVFATGKYYKLNDFYKDFNLTKDRGIAQIFRKNCKNISTIFKLKEMLNIDDETFLNILKEDFDDSKGE